MNHFPRKISKTQNFTKKRTEATLIGILLTGLLLAGCSLSPPASSPTATPVLLIPTSTPLPTEADSSAPPAEPAEPAAEPTNTPISNAADLPDPGSYTLTEFASGLDQPLYLTHAGDSSGRLFVIEKAGRIIILAGGQELPEPFLDIRRQVKSSGFETGLLGLAFHPNYPENGLFYVHYSDRRGDTVISRFQVSEDPNIADPDTEKVLLTVKQPYPNHNGGTIVFGPDGYLYIGLGDGGSGGDPENNAQNPEMLLGKILRIEVDNGDPYAIPPGNSQTGYPEIWAHGLRNPWRFSFDRVTGDLLIGDVGQNVWEEIHFLPAGIQGGINLGWDYFEGTHPFDGTPPSGAEFIFPVIEYQHTDGHCSVTGGYVYRGALPEWQGVYLYGDFCSGAVWGALPGPDGAWQSVEYFRPEGSQTSFGEDEMGEIYVVYIGGTIYKLTEK